MTPVDMPELDYARIEKAILFLQQNFREQPSLTELARHVGLSDGHFQRLFKRWAGISPKRFLQYLTGEYVERLLCETHSNLLDVSLQAGLSGPGRLHDLIVNIHAATPGEMKRRGEGLAIRYGRHPTPFGDCLLAAMSRGICSLEFIDSATEENPLSTLQERWPKARYHPDQALTRPLVERIFASAENSGGQPLNLHLSGSNFQLRVWEALLKIPSGQLITYSDLAHLAGSPAAARAVGSANANNPVACLIPCHRVIRRSGSFGRYRWGTARKQALYGWEQARLENNSA